MHFYAGLAAGALVYALLGSDAEEEQPADAPQVQGPTALQPAAQQAEPASGSSWTQQLDAVLALLTGRLGFLQQLQQHPVPAVSPEMQPALASPPQPGLSARQPQEAAWAPELSRPVRFPVPTQPQWQTGPTAVGVSTAPTGASGGVLWQRRPPAAQPSASPAAGQMRQPTGSSVAAAGAGPSTAHTERRESARLMRQPRQLEDFWATPQPDGARAAGSSVQGAAGQAALSTVEQHDWQPGHRSRGSEPWQEQLRQEQTNSRAKSSTDPRSSNVMPSSSFDSSAHAAPSNGAQHSNERHADMQAASHADSDPQEQRPSTANIWNNFESMDDEVISSVISAAQRAGIRRRMWDN